MEKFCKLYETEEYGQILVKLDSSVDGDGTEVRFYINPPNFGLCSVAWAFPSQDEDEGIRRAQTFFDGVTEEMAKTNVAGVFTMSANLVEGER